MDIQDVLIDGQKNDKKDTAKSKPGMESESIQYNSQDLDQEQKVNVNPVQLNTQNLHVFINQANTNTGKITGSTLIEKSRKIAPNADIAIYFSNTSKLPVYRTNSDKNGNYAIEDIPPGYYILAAAIGEDLKYQSHYIKVLTGQDINHIILLK